MALILINLSSPHLLFCLLKNIHFVCCSVVKNNLFGFCARAVSFIKVINVVGGRRNLEEEFVYVVKLKTSVYEDHEQDKVQANKL